MNERETAFETIVNDIKEQEELVDGQIKNEVEFSYEDQINTFKKSLEKEIELYYEKQISELKVISTTEKSQLKLKSKKELLILRQKMVENLFSNVMLKLKEFTQTSEYKDYIVKNLNSIKNLDEKSYFLVKSDDIELFKMILKEKSLNNEVREDNILIGGFRLIDITKSLEYDFTLETSLKEEKQWFQNNSGFTI